MSLATRRGHITVVTAASVVQSGEDRLELVISSLKL